ncbi:MAG: radical SAM peptide maturase, CXXX-repeat target family [Planctomycetia bacterium]|nr:radical SAM peptide maturase, CXXX-repeat target family [Planctomycetia bacterium]
MAEWKEGSAKSVTLVLTEDCQLRCKYCYLCGKNSTTKMTFEIAKEAIDYVLDHREIYSEEAVVWDFIGGEPFMEIELMDKICDYIKQRMFELNHPWFNNYRFSMATNGLMYDDARVQKFIEKNAAHLSIGISVDGTKEKHDAQRVFPNGEGSYERVVRNVPLWLEQFQGANTKATIGHEDLPLVKDSVLHLWNLGIKEVAMNCIFEDVWQDGDDQILEEQLVALADEILEKKLYLKYNTTLFDRFIGFELTDNQNWCGAGRMVAVDTKGNLHPCVRFVQYSLEKKSAWVTGNAEEGLDFNKIRPFLALNRTVQSPQECIDCEVASGCAWCQGHNYDSADTETIYQRATYICKMHKARVRANNYLWNKLDKIVPPPEDDERVRRLAMRKGMQHLMVIADTDAPSFCYYPTRKVERQKMSVETLKKVVYYALTHNLALNVIVGNEPLDEAFRNVLDECQHVILRPIQSAEKGEGIDVFDFETDSWPEKAGGGILILRIEAKNLPQLSGWLEEHSLAYDRIQIFVKDVEKVGEEELVIYQNVLKSLVDWLPEREEKKPLEISFLTDRLMLEKPNHCDAGIKHVTVAPNGKFYVCPGFFYREKNQDFVISDIDTVLETHELPIKNKQLYQLDHAPICENCDAWQCKRCVFLNKETTLEVNTPSRQQCVMAHLERNASRDLIEPLFLTEEVTIPEIDYLDPFEELMKKKYPTEKGGKVDEC